MRRKTEILIDETITNIAIGLGMIGGVGLVVFIFAMAMINI